MLKNVHGMCQKIMESQEEQDNFNREILDKLNSVLKLENKKSEEQEPEEEKDVGPGVTEETMENSDEPISLNGKWFTLKHTFKNVSKFGEGVEFYSVEEEHFGMIWKMNIQRNEEYLAFSTWCADESTRGLWSIETDCEVKLLLKDGTSDVRRSCDLYQQDKIENIREFDDWGWEEYIEWDDLDKKYLIDDSLTFEVSFKIKNTTGIYKDNLRCFDDKECSDIVLAVQDEKFHVAKLFLATHSSYFKVMFLGMFGESKKSEIPLTGIDADDFQNYLEVLYGDDAIDEYTVEGLLMVSDMYDTQIVIKKCQQFLLEKSKKTMKKKLEMSIRYNLDELKNKCLSEIKTIDDIRRIIPGDIKDLNPSLTTILLEKAIHFSVISS